MLVTAVLPNSGDIGQLRPMIEEALMQERKSDDDVKAHDDGLLDYTIVMDQIFQMVSEGGGKGKKGQLKDGNCPFCKRIKVADKLPQNRCQCEYHIAYAYKLETEATLKVVTKSKQRGGSARLLSTDKGEHWANLQEGINQRSLERDSRDFKAAVFGIMLVSHTGIFFMKENPDRWEADLSTRRDTELQNKFKGLRDQDKAGDNEGDLGVLGLVRLDEADVTDLKNLEGLSVINGRVPTLEVVSKNKGDKGAPKKQWFAMLSDSNVQETLERIRALKRAAVLKSVEDAGED